MRRRVVAAPAALALPYAAKDTIARTRARKRAKREGRLDKAYLAWVHTRPCCVCGVYGIEAHHQPRKSQDGGSTWHDRLTLPLCAEHHRGAAGIHLLGVAGFEEAHGLDIAATIAALHEAYANGTDSPPF